MAEELSRQELAHQQKLQRAVRALRKDPDLRYLMRQFLHLCQLDSNLDLQSTNTAMHGFGRQSAARDMCALLMIYDITLYADLLREDALEATTENHDV